MIQIFRDDAFVDFRRFPTRIDRCSDWVEEIFLGILICNAENDEIIVNFLINSMESWNFRKLCEVKKLLNSIKR